MLWIKFDKILVKITHCCLYVTYFIQTKTFVRHAAHANNNQSGLTSSFFNKLNIDDDALNDDTQV